SCPTATPVLQVPAGPLLEGDTVTLRCRVRQKNPAPFVRFFHHEKGLAWYIRQTELSLPPLQLRHSGRYRCSVEGRSWPWPPVWDESAPVAVTVHGEHPTPHTSV
ncbi:FCGR2 protein, partial [Nicator chloris]|nr:FCGR2 protein [Nicator chloris]